MLEDFRPISPLMAKTEVNLSQSCVPAILKAELTTNALFLAPTWHAGLSVPPASQVTGERNLGKMMGSFNQIKLFPCCLLQCGAKIQAQEVQPCQFQRLKLSKETITIRFNGTEELKDS